MINFIKIIDGYNSTGDYDNFTTIDKFFHNDDFVLDLGGLDFKDKVKINAKAVYLTSITNTAVLLSSSGEAYFHEECILDAVILVRAAR